MLIVLQNSLKNTKSLFINFSHAWLQKWKTADSIESYVGLMRTPVPLASTTSARNTPADTPATYLWHCSPVVPQPAAEVNTELWGHWRPSRRLGMHYHGPLISPNSSLPVQDIQYIYNSDLHVGFWPTQRLCERIIQKLHAHFCKGISLEHAHLITANPAVYQTIHVVSGVNNKTVCRHGNRIIEVTADSSVRG